MVSEGETRGEGGGIFSYKANVLIFILFRRLQFYSKFDMLLISRETLSLGHLYVSPYLYMEGKRAHFVKMNCEQIVNSILVRLLCRLAF